MRCDADGAAGDAPNPLNVGAGAGAAPAAANVKTPPAAGAAVGVAEAPKTGGVALEPLPKLNPPGAAAAGAAKPLAAGATPNVNGCHTDGGLCQREWLRLGE